MTINLFQTSKPCDFKALAESKIFVYKPSEADANCKNSDLAEVYVSNWEDELYEGKPNAADFNNIACAYLWLKEPNWDKASELFILASKKSQGKNKTIESNKRRIEYKVKPRVKAKPALKVRSAKKSKK